MAGPLHMQEIQDDVPILPKDNDEISPDDAPPNTAFVDLGSIQTDPKIGKSFAVESPCFDLVL